MVPLRHLPRPLLLHLPHFLPRLHFPPSFQPIEFHRELYIAACVSDAAFWV